MCSPKWLVFLLAVFATTSFSAQSFQFLGTAPAKQDPTLTKASYIAINSAHEVFITDVSTKSINVFDSTGTRIETINSVITPEGKIALKAPKCIFIDIHDDLYIYDDDLTKVFVKRSKGNGFSFGEKGSGLGQIDDVLAITVDSEGYIYLLNGARKEVDVFSPDGAFLSWIAGASNTFSDPVTIGMNGNDELYVMEHDGPSVFMYDVYGNLINTNRTLSRKKGISVTKPVSMAVLRNGDFFILDGLTCSATQFDKLSNVQGTVGSKGVSSNGVFQQTTAIACGTGFEKGLVILDGEKNITQVFRVETGTPALRTQGRRMRIVPTAATRPTSVDLAVAPNGNRYVIPATGRDVVVAYRDTSNNEIFVARGKFEEAEAIATDAGSNLYVVDRKGNEVVMFDPQGTLVKKFGKDIPKKLKDPTGIVIQSSGNIIVADHSNGNIHLWNASGVYQKILVVAETSGITSPYKVQVDSKDQIYVWDDKQNAILRIASNGWPVALKKITARPEKSGGSDGLIGGFYVDPLDRIHLYNATTHQLEIYEWDLEPVFRFTAGHPGTGKLAFNEVSNILFDKDKFLIYFSDKKDLSQQVFQFFFRPPTPDDKLQLNVASNGKVTVMFNKLDNKSITEYGLVTNGKSGQDSLAAITSTSMLELAEEMKGDLTLHHYGLVSVSHKNLSEPSAGFDNYLGHGQRLAAAGYYVEALAAFRLALERMGGQQAMRTFISAQLTAAGRILALRSDAALALQYVQLAYSITPDDAAMREAYAMAYAASFQQQANRGDIKGILIEAERLVGVTSLKPVVLMAVDSVSLSLAQIPNENSINNAVKLQKKLVEWAPQNASYNGSLARISYEFYKFKRNLGRPAFELDLLLKDADKYGQLAVNGLRQNKQPYFDAQLLLMEILNAEGRYADVEKEIMLELGVASTMPEPKQIAYHTQLAEAYKGQKKYELAVFEYQRILDKQPESIAAKTALASTLMAAGKYTDAKSIYQQLLVDDRNNTAYIAQIGEIELKNGNFVEASFQLEKAAKLDPTDRSFYGPLAEAFDGAANYQKALDNYKSAIQYQELKLNQARNHFASENEVKSIQHTLFKYLDRVGRLNEQTGNFEDAVDAYAQLTAEDPMNAEAFYGLGKACTSAGLAYDGIGAFNSAARLDPSNNVYSNAHANALKTRSSIAKDQPPLNILEIEVSDVYPSLYHNYGDVKQLALGDLVVANNTADPITPTSITVFVNGLMTAPTEIKAPAMVGYSNSTIKLAALFNDKILDHSADEKFQMDVVVNYNQNGQQKTSTKAAQFVLHGRNAITWKDKRRLSAFISPADNVLIDYNKKSDVLFRDAETFGLNKTILKAMQLYTVLHNNNMVYSADPVLAFATVSTNTGIMDYLQYPAETLKRKAGDCDDLVALYCALLENAGIATAYIDVPGHVFMAFDSGIKPDDLISSGLNALDVVIQDGKVWIPIETTLMGTHNFMTAWKNAADRYFKELNAGNFPEVVAIADARKVYIPSSYVPEGFQPEPPATKQVTLEYNNMLSQLLAKTKKEVIVEMQNRYQAEPENVFVKNKYAMLLAQTGELDKAEKVLNEALQLSATSPVILNNLGNLYYLRGNAPKAIDYYTQASQSDANDGEILINLCKSSLLAGKKADAQAWFGKAVALNANLESLYSNLKNQMK